MGNEVNFIMELPFAKIHVTNQDIDDIMDTAMSGCTYWCGDAKPVGEYLGKYASEQISRGGSIKFFPVEDEPAVLTLEHFKEGMKKYYMSEYMQKGLKHSIEEGADPEHIEIDAGCIDADEADTILQYALFGELVYG